MIYTGSGGTSLRPVCCCSCYRHLVCSRGYKQVREGEDPKSPVEGVKGAESSLAAQPCARIVLLCPDLPFHGAPCFPFYRRRKNADYRGGKEEREREEGF